MVNLLQSLHDRQDLDFVTDNEKRALLPLIFELVGYATTARGTGLEGFEDLLDEQTDMYLKQGLTLLVEATESEDFDAIMSNHILASDLIGVELLAAIIKYTGLSLIRRGKSAYLIEQHLLSLLGISFVERYATDKIFKTI